MLETIIESEVGKFSMVEHSDQPRSLRNILHNGIKILHEPIVSDDISHWRETMAEKILVFALLIIPFAIAFSFPYFFERNLILLVILDIVIVLWLILSLVIRRPPFRPSSITLIIIAFLFMLSFFILLGPEGARPIWIVICVVLSAVFYGMRGVCISIFLCTLMLCILYTFIPASFSPWYNAQAKSLNERVMNIVNINVLSFIIGVSVANLLQALEQQIGKIKAMNERYRLLSEFANDGILLIKDGIFVDCNQKTLEMLKCQRSQIINATPIDFSPEFQPDGLKSLKKAFLKMEMALCGKSQIFEWTHKRADGTLFDAEISLNAVELHDGTYLQAIVRDITKRKWQAEAFRFYKFASDSTEDMVAAIDCEYRYLFANRPYITRHYRKEEEITGKFLSEVIGKTTFNKLQPSIEEGFKGKKAYLEFEYQYPEIGLRYLEATFFPLKDDEKLLGVVSVIKDITTQKKAEASIEYETKFRRVLGEVTRDLISTSPKKLDDAIIHTLEAIGQFIEADRSYIMRFNFEDRTLSNTHEWCREGISAQRDRLQNIPFEIAQELVTQIINLKPVVMEDISLLPDGTTRDEFEAEGILSLVNVPLISHGKCVGIVGFDFVKCQRQIGERIIHLLEFTSSTLASAFDRQRAEKEKRDLGAQLRQSQKMEAIGRLTGGIAHDFNNMLCMILGYTELMLEDFSPENIDHEDIVEIHEAAKRATALTQQLLAFSRKQVIEPQIIDLNSIIKGLHSLLSRLIGENIQLHLTLSETLGSIWVDLSQIEQIIMNLAVNARDAMPEGGELHIKTSNILLDESYCKKHALSISGHYVILVITDTGHGINSEDKKKIFEPFFTTKRIGKGTGLGLATVYGIVEQSGGKIEVSSEQGKGTSFKVYFPQVDAVSNIDESLENEISHIDGSKSVLLVEDDNNVRNLAKKLLERIGCVVKIASSGVEAIELVNTLAYSPDLLLTDVIMPDMNGHELAQHLYKKFPNLKVLYASGYPKEVITNQEIMNESAFFISKPYTLSLLAKSVKRALDTKKYETANPT